MDTKQAVQELKAERVQQEAAPELPFQVSLKAERVQEPGVFSPGEDEQFSSSFELNLNLSQREVLKFDLMPLGAVVTVGS
jgi:hypothetical protein